VVDLATELDVAPSTVQKAVAALREDGRLYTALGQGSFVSKPLLRGAFSCSSTSYGLASSNAFHN
jgi:DNA-binding GntR family transcriptional regulator